MTILHQCCGEITPPADPASPVACPTAWKDPEQALACRLTSLHGSAAELAISQYDHDTWLAYAGQGKEAGHTGAVKERALSEVSMTRATAPQCEHMGRHRGRPEGNLQGTVL